jgi:hypothetical protein
MSKNSKKSKERIFKTFPDDPVYYCGLEYSRLGVYLLRPQRIAATVYFPAGGIYVVGGEMVSITVGPLCVAWF